MHILVRVRDRAVGDAVDLTPQDRERAGHFHRRCAEDDRIDRRRRAHDVADLVRSRPVPQGSA